VSTLKSRMFNFIMRNRRLLQGKFHKEIFDDKTSVKDFREKCERGAEKYGKIPEEVTVKAETIAGMKSEWLIPEGSDPEKIILYVHGGGYVSGSCSDHRGFVTRFARNCGVTNLLYEYRLAPEHPFPAALEDSVRIYQWLLDSGYKPENILAAGESAGGGLCLALLLALKGRNIPLPAAAVAISPWTDLTCSSESYRTKGKVSLAPTNSWTVFAKHYTGAHDPKNPLISPLFGDLKGLPPLFINSGVSDELYDDGEKFYLKAKDAGVTVTFRAGTEMVHCYPLLAPLFREATEAMNEICDFTRKHIGK
jgi:monoterpene epsilon-lactone hydrolase